MIQATCVTGARVSPTVAQRVRRNVAGDRAVVKAYKYRRETAVVRLVPWTANMFLVQLSSVNADTGFTATRPTPVPVVQVAVVCIKEKWCLKVSGTIMPSRIIHVIIIIIHLIITTRVIKIHVIIIRVLLKRVIIKCVIVITRVIIRITRLINV